MLLIRHSLNLEYRDSKKLLVTFYLVNHLKQKCNDMFLKLHSIAYEHDERLQGNLSKKWLAYWNMLSLIRST